MSDSLSQSLYPLLNTSARCIVVAYSGGVDSHVLLHNLCALREKYSQHQYRAVHIHHGLSDNADAWLQHCEKTCQHLAIELNSRKVQVDVAPRTSLEATARNARYQAIESMVPANSLVLLAQHQDDQLETVLLQLKRGAGPKGLSAMGEVKSVNNGIQYARPFLSISRKKIEDYAEQQQLHWVEDESNTDDIFDRNFLRQQIIPLLTQRWPGMAKAVSRSAALCAQQQSLLDEVTFEHLARIQDPQQRLNIELLAQLSPMWQVQVVRLWLSQRHIPSPPAAVLDLLQTELLQTADDASPCLQWQQWQLRKYAGWLYAIIAPAEPVSTIIHWQQQVSLAVGATQQQLFFERIDNGGIELSMPSGNAKVTIAFGHLAAKFKPAGASHSKPLKKWMQLWQVPPWQRQHIPLIFVDNELAMVVGHAVAEGFTLGEVGYWIRYQG